MPARKLKAPEPQLAAATPKKPRKTDSDLELVVCALGAGGEVKGSCPESARTMLLEALPHAAAAAGTAAAGCARHAYQDEMLSLAGKVLKEDTDAVSEAHALSMNRAQEAEREIEALEARRAQAAEALAAATTESATRSAEVQAANREVESADAAQVKAQAATKLLVDAHETTERERAKVADVTNLCLKESAALNLEELATVISLLEEIRAEKALVAAVPGALSKLPSKRGRFDQITMESIAEVVGAKASKLDDDIAESKPTVEEEKAMALGMWAIYDVAKDKKVEASEVAAAAEAKREEAASEEKMACKQVEAMVQRQKDVLVAKVLSEEALAKSKQALEALARLSACEKQNSPDQAADPREVVEAAVEEQTDVGALADKVSQDSSPFVAASRVGG